jgi:hypothetical protein
MQPSTDRARWWEVAGAWLRIWTPPKDVEVPPVPTRKLAAWGAVLAIVVGLGLVLLMPALRATRERHTRAADAEHRAAVTAAERRLRVTQRVHGTHVGPGGYAALLPKLERAITRDAKARAAAHELPGNVVETRCRPVRKAAAVYPTSRVYKCTALSPATALAVRSGYPFVATIFARRGKLTWCRYSATPGEGSSFHPLAHVKVSTRCAGRLAKTL